MPSVQFVHAGPAGRKIQPQLHDGPFPAAIQPHKIPLRNPPRPHPGDLRGFPRRPIRPMTHPHARAPFVSETSVPEFRRNWQNLASRSPPLRSESIARRASTGRPRKHSEHFLIITPGNLSPRISSRCRRSHSVSLFCSWCWRTSSAATRRRSGLLGRTGPLARLPRNPSDGWAVCWREPSRTVVRCAPTDRSRPLCETHCLRRSSASKGSMRMP